MKHTISILVENHAGVLARVAGLFARRGFNIDRPCGRYYRGRENLPYHNYRRRNGIYLGAD